MYRVLAGSFGLTQRQESAILARVEQDSLRRQLELARFERAVSVTESLAEHRALLTTAELARINQILTGKNQQNPWRTDVVSLELPSGSTETLAIMADPIVLTRNKLHRATEACEAGHVIDAAVQLYVELVKAHVFTDANRRTAVLACHYFLCRYGVSVSGLAIHELGLGDVRDPQIVQSLKDTLQQMSKFTEKRRKV